ncbi:MAG: LLM class flavin-dependent oxidoreductase [Halieaceae bacterium]|nr:LLM class flavin-dependent oxidoreductase [Halieaceae bacterium]
MHPVKTNTINFGLWSDFRNPPPWAVPNERFYAESMEQILTSEALGYNSVWLTEHHYCEDGYTPSPLIISSAIAQRTTKMRVGTNLICLPLHDPIRIAEDAATISILSGGRFDLGVGLGYRQLEFDQVGRQLNHRPSLMEESVEIIRRAWRGEEINFEGKRFSVGNIQITPIPEHPPKILIGAMAPPAIARAARIGDGFLCSGTLGLKDYTQAAKNPAIYAGCWAIISDDPEREAARLGPHILYQVNEYIKWGAFGPPGSRPLYDDYRQAIEEGLYELWDAERAIEELSHLIETYPIRDIHFWSRFPGENIESGQARLEYIASKVLPILKKAKQLSKT